MQKWNTICEGLRLDTFKIAIPPCLSLQCSTTAVTHQHSRPQCECICSQQHIVPEHRSKCQGCVTAVLVKIQSSSVSAANAAGKALLPPYNHHTIPRLCIDLLCIVSRLQWRLLISPNHHSKSAVVHAMQHRDACK